MYRRFISPWPSDMRNVDYGIFQGIWICEEDYLLPSYLIEELRRETAWFNRNLPCPNRAEFEYASHNVGVCWFSEHAHEMIQHARHMAAIYRAGDIWITEVRTDNPGRILYRDDYQIIAQPNRRTPTRWG